MAALVLVALLAGRVLRVVPVFASDVPCGYFWEDGWRGACNQCGQSLQDIGHTTVVGRCSRRSVLGSLIVVE